MMKKLFTFLLCIMFYPSFAAESPKGSGFDKRVQYVEYNPDQVVLIRAKVGHVSMVQLAPEERIEGDSSGIAMGDSAAWNITVKGNNIFFKPTAPSPQTNLIIASNLRTYILGLSLANKNQAPTYILRFRYPDDEKKLRLEQYNKSLTARALFNKHNNVSITNLNYWGKGNKKISPTKCWDDGRFTYLKYSNAKALPAVFKILPDGTESLVNTHIDGDTLIIHELADKFILRLGKLVLSIENHSYDSKGKYNEKGTSDNDLIRLMKNSKKGIY